MSTKFSLLYQTAVACRLHDQQLGVVAVGIVVRKTNHLL
jgi:hypothetical protein